MFIGDSIGSFCEYSETRVAPDVLDLAMEMPGGGNFKVGPGQVTDDSELAFCSLWAILKSN